MTERRVLAAHPSRRASQRRNCAAGRAPQDDGRTRGARQGEPSPSAPDYFPATGRIHMARKYSKKASAKVARAMKKRKAGTLKSGRSGKKVKSRKQAIAIGLSEARAEGKKVPKKAAKKRKTAKKKRRRSGRRRSKPPSSSPAPRAQLRIGRDDSYPALRARAAERCAFFLPPSRRESWIAASARALDRKRTPHPALRARAAERCAFLAVRRGAARRVGA